MRYRTTIEQSGENTTGIPVPEEVLTALGHGRKPPVVVTVGNHTYRSTVATMNGSSIVSLSLENRTAAGVVGGQEVEVELQLDTQPRVVEVPDDLAAALAATSSGLEAFARLSHSKQKAHVLAVEGAKTPETRRRRVEKVASDVTA